MKNEKILRVIGEIDNKYIVEAATNEKRKKTSSWIKWGAIAACLAIFIYTGTKLIPRNDTDIQLRDLSWYEGSHGGGGSDGGLSDGTDNFGLFAGAKAISFSSLPVYIDAYPIHPATGREKATDEQIIRMEELHKKLMWYFSPDEEVEYFELNTFEGFERVCRDGVWSKVNGILFRTEPVGDVFIEDNALRITSKTTEDEVKEWTKSDPVLKAACLYAGIDRPIVKREINYKVSGDSGDGYFYIYQQGSTDIETLCNASLHVIKIFYYGLDLEHRSYQIRISRPDPGKVEGIYESISYEEAVANVMAGNAMSAFAGGSSVDKLEGEIIGVDIVYASFFKRGYVIPCYRFAVKKEEPGFDLKGNILFDCVYFPAVEFHAEKF